LLVVESVSHLDWIPDANDELCIAIKLQNIWHRVFRPKVPNRTFADCDVMIGRLSEEGEILHIGKTAWNVVVGIKEVGLLNR
jgi:hypothetical protein